MSRYSAPALSARYVNVSPIYDLGLTDISNYGQMLVTLFSGVVWLSRDALSANHIRFLLKSPGDSQFFAALKAVTPSSPFSKFTVEGALIECSLKETTGSSPGVVAS